MIVRIATEGQYELPDGQLARLDELDDAVVAAVESDSGEEFQRRYRALLEFVRAGRRHDQYLGASDVILPPPDMSLAEAAGEFTGEGLIPG